MELIFNLFQIKMKEKNGGDFEMYATLYHLMFHAVTDALRAMEAQNYGDAGKILRNAQCEAEARYVESLEGNKQAPVLCLFPEEP